MNRYAATAMTTATAATAENAISTLWNPSTTESIWVTQIHLFKQGGAGAVSDVAYVRRVSARGTQSTTFAPGIEHDFQHALAPPSAATIDMAWSVQPTYAGTAQHGLVGADIPNAQGSGFMWVFDEPVAIKSATGLGIVTGQAAAFPVSIVTWQWIER